MCGLLALRRMTFATCFVGLVACTSLEPARQGAVLEGIPEKPDQTATYVLYVHDNSLDRAPDDVERKARLQRVMVALANHGFLVIGEARPAGTIQKIPDDLDRYGQKLSVQVRQLLAAGVPARRINVVGYSRGATLALITSSHTTNADVGYAVLAGCMNDTGAFKQFAPILTRYAERFTGQYMSIWEQSDPDFGSCAPYFAKAVGKLTSSESVLGTGKGHQFAVEPEDSWVRPVVSWIVGRR